MELDEQHSDRTSTAGKKQLNTHFLIMITEDTICAIATARGGAIGVVRVSGTEAISIADKIFRGRKTLAEAKANSVVFGNIVDAERNIVDEVLVSVFRAPHSYTGEDSVEISCHGSDYILQTVMQLLIANGARTAKAGEYTKRAFLSGKIDLSQAEAVADLIASSSASTHRLALNQMRGGFSKELAQLREKLLKITSLLELELDFSEEDVEFADRIELRNLAATIEDRISYLTSSFKLGNAIKNGVPVAIIGETNAGKSTLLNRLLNEERAIVSNIHGTTRDVIEETLNIDGTIFRFIDTAGIRQTTDEIERIGIERSFQKMDKAEIVLWLIDSTTFAGTDNEAMGDIARHCRDKKLAVLLNKSDSATENAVAQCADTIRRALGDGIDIMSISALENSGIEELKQWLVTKASIPQVNESDIIVTNLRHYEVLCKAGESIAKVRTALDLNIPGDLVAEDLNETINILGEITGQISNDEVLGIIFKNFCVGK